MNGIVSRSMAKNGITKKESCLVFFKSNFREWCFIEKDGCFREIEKTLEDFG